MRLIPFLRTHESSQFAIAHKLIGEECDHILERHAAHSLAGEPIALAAERKRANVRAEPVPQLTIWFPIPDSLREAFVASPSVM